MSHLGRFAEDGFVNISGGIASAIVDLAKVIVSVVIVIFEAASKITLARDQGDAAYQHVECARRAISSGIRTTGAVAIVSESGDQGAVAKVTLGLEFTRKILLWVRGVLVLDSAHRILRPRILCCDQHWQCPVCPIKDNHRDSVVGVGRKRAITVVRPAQLSPDGRIPWCPGVPHPLAVAGGNLTWKNP